MKLYHYNVQHLDFLQSLYGRGISDEDKKRLGEWATKTDGPFAYTKNLSFFMEPIPLDLPEILHNEHTFWKSGLTLYEHVVDTKEFVHDIPYRLVEAAEKTDLIFRKQNWDLAENNPELTSFYKSQIADLEKELELEGTGVGNLVRVASRYKGIRNYYKEAYKLYKKFPKDNLISKYAACVPHLMVYPAEAKIKVSRVNEITLK